MDKELFHVRKREVSAQATAQAPCDKFHIEQFASYVGTENYDGSEGCDGGDYHHSIQIRLDDDGTIYTTVHLAEWSEHRTVSRIPYQEFVEKYCAWLKQEWPDKMSEWGGNTKADDALKILQQNRENVDK